MTLQQRALCLFVGFGFLLGAIGIVTAKPSYAQPTQREWDAHLAQGNVKLAQFEDLRDLSVRLDARMTAVEGAVQRIETKLDKFIEAGSQNDTTKMWAVLVAALLGGSGLTFGGVKMRQKVAR